MTLSELQAKVLDVLKMFDKISPDKVGTVILNFVVILSSNFLSLQVTLEAHFVNDLGLDSLDVVEIVMAFEDEFGRFITDVYFDIGVKIFPCLLCSCRNRR